MVHLCCLAHALHRISERIREQFSVLDRFIATTKKIFLKSPARVVIFREIADSIPLPPEPILTRWGTWLKAVEYYYHHFEIIQKVIEALPNDSKSVEKVKTLIDSESRHIKSDIAFVHINYGFIVEYIVRLESPSILLSGTMAILEDAKTRIESVPCRTGKIIHRYAVDIVQRGPDINKIRELNQCILNGTIVTSDIQLSNIQFYQFCNCTSVDTERVFSRYKLMVTDRRHFKFSNLNKYFSVNCNAFCDS